MKFKYLVLSSAIFGVLSLTGCGGGDGTTTTGTGGGDTPITTAFSVNVEVPDGLNTTEVASAPASFFDDFFISTAAAATVSDQLGAGNFKVAIVNAAGVVTEIVTPESISQEADGSWIVILAGGKRVDCVIIADISKTPEVTIGQTLPADAIYAPTASEQFDIDIRSTAAFQEFIEAVEDNLDLTAGSGFTEAQVAALVEAAQTLPLPAYSVGQTLEQYLVTAILELESEIEREVIVVNNTDTTFNFATYVENGGGINWYYGESSFYERGRISYDAATQVTTDFIEKFDGSTWITATGGVEGVVLTAQGWIAREDVLDITSLNADGSITIADTIATNYQEVLSAVKVDVSGQQIKLFVPGYSNVLSNTATFSTGAAAHLLSSTYAADIYEVWADDSSGALNAYERRNGSYNVITTLNEMFSATASTSTDPEQMNLVRNDPLVLEFIGSPTDTSGTVNIITIDYGTFPNVASVIGASTWERRTVNGKDVVLVAATGTALQDEEGDEGFYMLTVYPDNYSGSPAVVEGWHFPAGTVGEDGEYLFNDIAAQDINGSFDPNRLTCGFSSGWDDAADGGLGAPISPNSFADFEAVVIDCGAFNIATSDVAGDSFSEGGAITTYDAMATVATEVAPGTGNFIDASVNENIDFKWYLEAATCSGCTHDYLIVYSDSTIDADLPADFEFRETAALTSISGSLFSFTHYTEQSNYGDMLRSTGTDGEIWNDTVVLQP